MLINFVARSLRSETIGTLWKPAKTNLPAAVFLTDARNSDIIRKKKEKKRKKNDPGRCVFPQYCCARVSAVSAVRK